MTTCAWFLMCDREAVGTVSHPILGDVPTCARCRRLAEPDHADYPHEPGTLYDCPACERIMTREVDQDDDDPDDHEFGCTCIFCTPGA